MQIPIIDTDINNSILPPEDFNPSKDSQENHKVSPLKNIISNPELTPKESSKTSLHYGIFK